MASPADEPGSDRVAHYRILHEIGRGGQATVYLADDTRRRREVALKVLDIGPAANKQAIDRFRREAEITSKLDHPGICPVYETGEERGVLWIAMRYVEGRTLAQDVATARSSGLTEGQSFVEFLEDVPASAPDRRNQVPSGPSTRTAIEHLLLIFEKAARALHVAHDAGIVHRDIKPGNIMITKDGDPVILDFGLAQELDGDLPTLTLTGDMMGTPAYMSPEQIAAQRIRLDRRTDVYSLGVTLYECLTLRRPFDEPTRERLYQAILTKSPADARELNPAVSADVRVVLETALEKDRDRRYATALDLAEDLRRVRASERILAKPASWALRFRRWAKRNPVLATAAAGVLAALLISIALLVQVASERDAKNQALNAKTEALSDYDRLGDLSRLQHLVAQQEKLWPPNPSNAAALRTWVDQAVELTSRLDGHREVLARLRGSALPDEDRTRETTTGSRPTSAKASSPSNERRIWKFASTSEQFKHDTTEKLVADLTAFADPDRRTGVLVEVRGRLLYAENIERETFVKYGTAWADAIRSISDTKECPKYGGLVIKPQLGLIPIGKDAASGLWEFADILTMATRDDQIMKRDEKGRLVVTQTMGLVFVLLPGGTFRMGAIRPDEDQLPTEPNIDPDAANDESPVNEVRLDPFFLSKYEMTQAQWYRKVRKNPSQYTVGTFFADKTVDGRHPVEQVTLEACILWLGRLGLTVPTEAQWEYGARGGTTTPRWTGIGTEGLEKAMNVADDFCRRNGGARDWRFEAWDDGYTVHAPVGSFAPNPFGLHDILGNVWEYCRDDYGKFNLPARAGDGLREPGPSRFSVIRGGAFDIPASLARSAVRWIRPPDIATNNTGVRPARSLDR